MIESFELSLHFEAKIVIVIHIYQYHGHYLLAGGLSVNEYYNYMSVKTLSVAFVFEFIVDFKFSTGHQSRRFGR